MVFQKSDGQVRFDDSNRNQRHVLGCFSEPKCDNKQLLPTHREAIFQREGTRRQYNHIHS